MLISLTSLAITIWAISIYISMHIRAYIHRAFSPTTQSDTLVPIYIYSHPQTDLFRSIRTHQCG